MAATQAGDAAEGINAQLDEVLRLLSTSNLFDQREGMLTLPHCLDPDPQARHGPGRYADPETSTPLDHLPPATKRKLLGPFGQQLLERLLQMATRPIPATLTQPAVIGVTVQVEELRDMGLQVGHPLDFILLPDKHIDASNAGLHRCWNTHAKAA